jgi:hypothetical protein
MKYQVGELVRLNIGKVFSDNHDKVFSDNHDKLAIIIEYIEGRYLPYKCIVQGVPEETFLYAAQHMEKV